MPGSLGPHGSGLIRGILLGLYGALVFWWVVIFRSGYVGRLDNYAWVVLLTVIPVVGGLYGLYLARFWGAFRSVFGRGVLFLALGLLGWSFGDFVWSYYNIFRQVEVPYPSVADFGFFSIVPFWFLGMTQIARASGARYALRTARGKILLVAIPILVFVLSYYLFLADKTIEQGDPLKVFFDIAYPLGDMFTASAAVLALLLTAGFLGGRMRVPILVLIVGFIVQYLADFSFSYTSTTGTYFNASWVDMLYLTSQFIVSFGVAMLVPPEA